jgi:hypothetical protein
MDAENKRHLDSSEKNMEWSRLHRQTQIDKDRAVELEAMRMKAQTTIDMVWENKEKDLNLNWSIGIIGEESLQNMKIWINGQLPPRLVKLDKDNKYDGTLAYLFGTIWET